MGRSGQCNPGSIQTRRSRGAPEKAQHPGKPGKGTRVQLRPREADSADR